MRIIAHLDMDAFYAAVEERFNPALRGVPLVVGADPKHGSGRGVVTTANYMARRYGIRSALPISRAWRLAEAACNRGEPETLFVQPNMPLYREISTRVMKIVEAYADTFEQPSIDEAYLDVSSRGDLVAATRQMRALKSEIRAREGLGCSIGIGPNKLIAKIASGHQKPDGLTVISPENVDSFLGPLPLRVLPGIGPKSERFLHQQNLHAVADLRQIPEVTLVEWFGKWGTRLFERCRGIDHSKVSNEWLRKSLGEQETFDEDSRSESLVSERLTQMAERIIEKVSEKHFSGFRTVTLTVRFADFQTCNRSRTIRDGILIEDADALGRLKKEASAMMAPFFDARENPRAKAFRLIGLRVEKLF